MNVWMSMLVSAAMVLLASSAAAQAMGGANFRSESSTFGFNDVPKLPAPKAAVAESDRRASAERMRLFALNAVPKSAQESNALERTVSDYVKYCSSQGDWKTVRDFLDEMLARRSKALSAKYVCALDLDRIPLYVRLKDERAFEAAVAAGLKDGVTVGTLAFATAVRSRLNNVRPKPWKAIDRVGAAFYPARAKLPAAERATVFEMALLDASERRETDRVRRVWKDVLADKELPARNLQRLRERYVDFMRQNRFYAEAVVEMERLPHSWRDCRDALTRARTYYYAGDRAASRRWFGVVLTNEVARPQERSEAELLAARLDAKSPEAFAAAVAALRAKDATPLDEFRRLRGAARILMTFSSNEEDAPYTKAVVARSDALLEPEQKIVYDVRFLADSPSTADGALRSDVFGKLKLENRIGPYNAYGQMQRSRQEKRVADGTGAKVRLEADEKGKEGVVCASCDTRGLHVYLRLNDPDAHFTRDGLRNGSKMELTLQPGDGFRPWHWNILSAGDPDNEMDVPWDSPRKGYRPTHDCLKTDCRVAEDCYCYHVFFPWIGSPYELPKNGSKWHFVAILRWAGLSRSIGSGAVHEIGRGMTLQFALSKEEERALRFGLLKEAAVEYRTLRSAWEKAEFWNDPHLGDVEFYGKVVQPLLKELDGVVAEIGSGKATDERLEQIYGEYLEKLADFRLCLDALRAEWVRKSLFCEKAN